MNALSQGYGGEHAQVGFKSHLRVAVVPGEAVYLVSDAGVTTLCGGGAEVLAPLLDGTRNVAEIISAATVGAQPQSAVDETLHSLAAAGLIRGYSAPAGRSADEAYWDLAGLDGARVTRTLTDNAVEVIALGPTDPAQAVAACLASGLTAWTAPAGHRDADRAALPPSALSLVLCTDYLDPRLAGIDARHRAEGRPWLLAKPGGAASWVGPVFRPEEGPCWSCLAERLRGHRRAERVIQRALDAEEPLSRPEASLTAGRAVGLQTAVLEAAKWLAGLRNGAQHAVLVLDSLEPSSRLLQVRRRPQCPACGDPRLVAARVGAPFVPSPRPKVRDSGSGHRATTAEQTLSAYRHLVGPISGVVRALRRDHRGTGIVDCYVSGPNLAMESHSLTGLGASLRALSGGKGLTPTEAKVSALAEAVERYSGTRQGDEPTTRASLRSLGAAAVHPNSCQLFDERQFRERELWNRAGSPLRYVPERFDQDRPVDWTPVWSLTHGRQRLLPTSMLYFDAGRSDPDGLLADSNGNAAGASPEDAVVQGFLELVERDAVALWWYNRTRQPGVDLDAFDEPWVDRVREGCQRIDRTVWALDLTSDLGIPVVAALSRRTDTAAEDIVFGFGAHFDPRIALRRALTEMSQLLPAAAATPADGSGHGVGAEAPQARWRRTAVADQEYLRPGPDALRGPGSWEFVRRADLADDVAAIVTLMGRHGMELLVLDQTRPDIGLPVVKVLVPGLRHFWPRFGPGRLFDVPVALGRLAAPTPYDRLNPIPLM